VVYSRKLDLVWYFGWSKEKIPSTFREQHKKKLKEFRNFYAELVFDENDIGFLVYLTK